MQPFTRDAVPVILKDGRLIGIEAVIDKDGAACMIGKTLGAEGLMILTDVSNSHQLWQGG